MTTDATFDYGDLLDGQAGGWRSRLIWLAALALLLAAVATGVWWQFMRGSSSAAVTVQTATVDRGAISKTVSTSGTVSAQQTSSLAFASSGKVTKVNVTLGQQVKTGDVLAEIDPTDLQTALDAANANLATAQSKLDQLLDGATASALASADQSVIQARANYDKALRAMQALQDPPTATDLASAQQAVASAEAQLGQAQQSRDKLDETSEDAVTSAESAVDKAEKALSQAESAAATAGATIASSQSALYNAETAYCPDGGVSFCGSHTAPISSADEDTLVSVSNGSDASRALAASKVLSANTSYVKALADQQAADDAVDTAQFALDDANDALDKAGEGSTSADVASADAAVSSAEVAVESAQEELTDLQNGATQDELAAAQSDIDSAEASLTSAEAKRDETYSGSDEADIQQQRQVVAQQQSAVTKAVKDLDDAKLIAPFDGTVAVLNVQVGDTSGSSTGSSSSAPIVLNTPNAVRLDLTISETDLPNVKVGQAGFATFDAITGVQFPIIIDSIGTNPTTTQGVVTYAARARLLTATARPTGTGTGGAPVSPPSAPGAGASATVTIRSSGATTPSANATPGAGSGIRTPGAGGFALRTPGANSTPGAGQGGLFSGAAAGTPTTAKPMPGMNAKLTIIVDSRQDVLRVPTSAVTRQGAESVVEVKQSDGTSTKVPVQAGLSDGQRIEIVSGIEEGATVILPGAVATTGATGTGAGTTTGGFTGGNFAPPIQGGGGITGGGPQ